MDDGWIGVLHPSRPVYITFKQANDAKSPSVCTPLKGPTAGFNWASYWFTSVPWWITWRKIYLSDKKDVWSHLPKPLSTRHTFFISCWICVFCYCICNLSFPLEMLQPILYIIHIRHKAVNTSYRLLASNEAQMRHSWLLLAMEAF